MEALSRLVEYAVNGCYSSRCIVGEEGVKVLHLLFAYHILISCEASQDQLTSFGCLLIWFGTLSRLKIN